MVNVIERRRSLDGMLPAARRGGGDGGLPPAEGARDGDHHDGQDHRAAIHLIALCSLSAPLLATLVRGSGDVHVACVG